MGSDLDPEVLLLGRALQKQVIGSEPYVVAPPGLVWVVQS